ncbi:hypothetical protein ABPG72_011515 [Tetrahymena utriculariae]
MAEILNLINQLLVQISKIIGQPPLKGILLSVQDKPKTGKPLLVDQHPNISLILECMIKDENKVYSTRNVQQSLESDYDIKISKDSTNKLLQDLGFKYGRFNMIHMLTEQTRFKDCNTLKEWIEAHLEIQLLGLNAFSSIRDNNLQIQYNKENPKAFSQKQYQYKETYVHVWSAIGGIIKFSLYFYSQKIGSDQYINSQNESLLPFLEENSNDEILRSFKICNGLPTYTLLSSFGIP